MVLRGGPRGRVGHRRTCLKRAAPGRLSGPLSLSAPLDLGRTPGLPLTLYGRFVRWLRNAERGTAQPRAARAPSRAGGAAPPKRPGAAAAPSRASAGRARRRAAPAERPREAPGGGQARHRRVRVRHAGAPRNPRRAAAMMRSGQLDGQARGPRLAAATPVAGQRQRRRCPNDAHQTKWLSQRRRWMSGRAGQRSGLAGQRTAPAAGGPRKTRLPRRRGRAGTGSRSGPHGAAVAGCRRGRPAAGSPSGRRGAQPAGCRSGRREAPVAGSRSGLHGAWAVGRRCRTEAEAGLAADPRPALPGHRRTAARRATARRGPGCPIP
jgi:hypothetical protein